MFDAYNRARKAVAEGGGGVKVSRLIKLLSDAAEKEGDIEVYHWSGYEPIARKDFVVESQRADARSNLVTHYGAKSGEHYIILNVRDQ